MTAFGRALPVIRRRCDADLRKHGLPREKALAAVVYLMDRTLIRVGNREYAERNGSFGLTTLRDRHVDFSGRRCTFQFRGKGGKDHVVEIEDKRLARIVRRCRDVPGQTLFQYYAEDGSRCSIGSSDVNSFIRETTQESFTAKDFRTWGASVHAAVFLNELDRPSSEAQADKHIVDVIKMVANRLGNTPAICRDYYIHPELYRSYREGRLRDLFAAGLRRKTPPFLDPEEGALLHLLEKTCAR
jgi:DNA topoisomerase-1